MQDRIRRPAAGDPDRAARLREIALKAAAKRRANLAAGIVPAKRASAKVAALIRRVVIPVMDALDVVGDCRHSVADLFALAKVARGEGAAPVAVEMLCVGCEAVGRSHGPARHENGTGPCNVMGAVRFCACQQYVAGQRPVALAARAERIPQTITIGATTYKRLGKGVSRAAYDLGCGEHVLKVQYSDHNGLEFQSKAECDFYEQAGDDIRPFLARIDGRSDDYRLELCEKVALQRPDDGEADMRAAAAKHKIGDLHPGNVGWRNGRMVILDIGFANRRNGW